MRYSEDHSKIGLMKLRIAQDNILDRRFGSADEDEIVRRVDVRSRRLK